MNMRGADERAVDGDLPRVVRDERTRPVGTFSDAVDLGAEVVAVEDRHRQETYFVHCGSSPNGSTPEGRAPAGTRAMRSSKVSPSSRSSASSTASPARPRSRQERRRSRAARSSGRARRCGGARCGWTWGTVGDRGSETGRHCGRRAAGVQRRYARSERIDAGSVRVPPPLAPGDAVAVVAPSSPFPRDELWRGLAWLRSRYRIVASRPGAARAGRVSRRAATSGARRSSSAPLADPEAKAIVAARGGYGAMRIARRAAVGRARAAGPSGSSGFSDVTALHAMAWRAGVASVHGPNVTGLGRDGLAAAFAPPGSRRSSGRPRPRVWRGLRVLRAGERGDRIVGGNLALVHAMAAAGRLVVPEGAVLALEDVTEAPYRVDRMLTSLRARRPPRARCRRSSSAASSAAPAGADGRTIDEVLEERTPIAGHPRASRGAPFGHGRATRPSSSAPRPASAATRSTWRA